MDMENDFLLILGDCTDNGSVHEYNTFIDSLIRSGVKSKTIIIPGNHDYRFQGILKSRNCYNNFIKMKNRVSAINCTDEEQIRPTKQFFSIRFVDYGVTVVTLDSSWEGKLARGFICCEQLFRLESVLIESQSRNDKIIVALHHDPWNTKFASCLSNTKTLHELLVKYRESILIVMSGHNHRFENVTLDGVSYCTIADLPSNSVVNYLSINLVDKTVFGHVLVYESM
jgi:3',5'-cyclic AMP phosphodiesterase CpdA